MHNAGCFDHNVPVGAELTDLPQLYQPVVITNIGQLFIGA